MDYFKKLEKSSDSGIRSVMSIAELKKTADSLTAKERQWLRAYLFVDERTKTEAWKTEMSARRKRLKAGVGMSESDYKRTSRKTP